MMLTELLGNRFMVPVLLIYGGGGFAAYEWFFQKAKPSLWRPTKPWDDEPDLGPSLLSQAQR